MVILRPKHSHPHGRRRLAIWPERGSRSTLVSLQRVNGLKGAGADAGASCGLSRYLRYDSMGKTCWTTWLDSKDFFFLSTSELDMFFFHICFFFECNSKTCSDLSVCVSIFFLGRHTFCVCIRSNLFLCPMCVCVCETSFFMCRDSLWSPLVVFAFKLLLYLFLFMIFISFFPSTNESVGLKRISSWAFVRRINCGFSCSKMSS